MANKTTFSLYIDANLKNRLEEVSKKSRNSMAKIIEQVLEENLPVYEKKFGIQPKLKL